MNYVLLTNAILTKIVLNWKNVLHSLFNFIKVNKMNYIQFLYFM